MTGVRTFKDKVYIGISGTDDLDPETDMGDGFTKKGNIISGGPVSAGGSSATELTVESWRENF